MPSPSPIQFESAKPGEKLRHGERYDATSTRDARPKPGAHESCSGLSDAFQKVQRASAILLIASHSNWQRKRAGISTTTPRPLLSSTD